ncbi:MAG TPA: hypothetical protein VHK67_07280 [Rhabdochlamydiaceae bacterium]|jgi:hypothetical protein|nr:hypothetical protein [Rhabdochlamydiaceae bacterium]
MGIEGCNCSEFERRDGYISCESLMAGEISSLKDKPLPRDLFGMDQREYAVINAEEVDLKAIADKEARVGLFATSLVSLLASMVGVVFCLVIRNFALASVLLFLGGMSAGFLIYTSRRTESEKNKIRDIDDNRLARLRNKVGILEGKISDAREFKEDLIGARDFFKTKYDIYLCQRNKPSISSMFSRV